MLHIIFIFFIIIFSHSSSHNEILFSNSENVLLIIHFRFGIKYVNISEDKRKYKKFSEIIIFPTIITLF